MSYPFFAPPTANSARPRHAPTQPHATASTSSSFRFSYKTRHAGKTIAQVAATDPAYLDWLVASRQGRKLDGYLEALIEYRRGQEARPIAPAVGESHRRAFRVRCEPELHVDADAFETARRWYDFPQDKAERVETTDRHRVVDGMVGMGWGLGQNANQHAETHKRCDGLERLVEEEVYQLGVGMGHAFAKTDAEVRQLGEHVSTQGADGKAAVQSVVQHVQTQGAHTMAAIRTVAEQVRSFMTGVRTTIRDVRADVQEGTVATNENLVNISHKMEASSASIANVSATVNSTTGAIRQDVQHLAASSQHLWDDVKDMGTRSDQRLAEIETDFRTLTQSFRGAREDIQTGFRLQHVNTSRGFAHVQVQASNSHGEVMSALERISDAVGRQPNMSVQTANTPKTEPVADVEQLTGLMRQMQTSLDTLNTERLHDRRQLLDSVTTVLKRVEEVDEKAKERGKDSRHGRVEIGRLLEEQNMASRQVGAMCAEILDLLQLSETFDGGQAEVGRRLAELEAAQDTASTQLGATCTEILKLLQSNPTPSNTHHLSPNPAQQAKVADLESQLALATQNLTTVNAAQALTTSSLTESTLAYQTAQAFVNRQTSTITTKTEELADLKQTHRGLYAKHDAQVDILQRCIQTLHADLSALKKHALSVTDFQRNPTLLIDHLARQDIRGEIEDTKEEIEDSKEEVVGSKDELEQEESEEGWVAGRGDEEVGAYLAGETEDGEGGKVESNRNEDGRME